MLHCQPFQPRPSASARVLTHAVTHVRQRSHLVRPPWHSVDGHALQIDELQGTKPTEKIDLSGKGLGVASGIIIASCVKENDVLKELKCAAHPSVLAALAPVTSAEVETSAEAAF